MCFWKSLGLMNLLHLLAKSLRNCKVILSCLTKDNIFSTEFNIINILKTKNVKLILVQRKLTSMVIRFTMNKDVLVKTMKYLHLMSQI